MTAFLRINDVVRYFAYGTLLCIPFALYQWTLIAQNVLIDSTIKNGSEKLRVHSKVSLVLINHSRLQNVHWIVENVTSHVQHDATRQYHTIVDQIIVWDDPDVPENTFVFNHQMVDIVRGPHLDIFKRWGLMGRFKLAAARSRNEQILIHDDDEQLLVPAILDMVSAKHKDPDRIVCAYGREVSQPNRPYTVSYYMPDARAPSHPPICLTKALLTDRRFCLEVTRWMARLENATVGGIPMWNGEDIAHSLTATLLTGKLHTVLPVDRRFHFTLPAPHGIGDKANNVGGWDHGSFRKNFTRDAAKILGLSGSDLFKQRIESTGIIPSRIGPLTALPQVETLFGSKNICIVTRMETKNDALGHQIVDNHRTYAAKHGYPYRVYYGRISGDELFDSSAGGLHTVQGGALNWQKIPAVKNMLKAAQVDNKHDLCKWVMWIDPSAVFTNFNQSLEPLIDRFRGTGNTVPKAKVGLFSRRETPGKLMVDSDVFFVRNLLSGFRMLETLAGMYREYKHFGIGSEQFAFQDYVLQLTPNVDRNLTWDDVKSKILPELAVVPHRTFATFYRPDSMSWRICDVVAKIRSTNTTWKLHAALELNIRADTCNNL